MLTNFRHENLILPKATVPGVADEVPKTLVENKKNNQKSSNIESSTRPRKKSKKKALYKSSTWPKEKIKNEALYTNLIVIKLDHFSFGTRRLIEPVLQKYAHVFHDENVRGEQVKDQLSKKTDTRLLCQQQNSAFVHA
jgi:hypothetical protein